MSAPDQPKPALARYDLISGIVLALFGAFIAIESWRMPRLEERGIDPWTAPGTVPGVLGVALAILGIVLAIRGRGGLGQPADIVGTGAGRTRFVLALALNLVYALALIGRLPFWLATFLYLTAFMFIFGLEANRPGALMRGLMIVIVAGAATAAVVYLFETLFLVILP